MCRAAKMACIIILLSHVKCDTNGKNGDIICYVSMTKNGDTGHGANPWLLSGDDNLRAPCRIINYQWVDTQGFKISSISNLNNQISNNINRTGQKQLKILHQFLSRISGEKSGLITFYEYFMKFQKVTASYSCRNLTFKKQKKPLKLFSILR